MDKNMLLKELPHLGELSHALAEPKSEWSITQAYMSGVMLCNKDRGLYVGASVMAYDDSKRWLHVSVSQKDRKVPSWKTMCFVKDEFIGQNRKAIRIHPQNSNYVNIHSACLHLWCCLDGDNLPEFSHCSETGEISI